MALLIGMLLAFAVGVFGTASGLDRDRAFYTTVAIVVASYYALFAVIGATTDVIVIESLLGGLFLVVATIGFRSSLWLVATALAAHGVFDLAHGLIVANPGVPAWWPAWCLGYDVAAGAYLSWLIGSGRVRAVA
jgi:hypothetical protein